jgi:hypothetical protein
LVSLLLYIVVANYFVSLLLYNAVAAIVPCQHHWVHPPQNCFNFLPFLPFPGVCHSFITRWGGGRYGVEYSTSIIFLLFLQVKIPPSLSLSIYLSIYLSLCRPLCRPLFRPLYQLCDISGLDPCYD